MDKKTVEEIKRTIPNNVMLIAVSKMHTKKEIDEAYSFGLTTFGENKVQEMKDKYNPQYHWHMIGHLQRNKVKEVVSMADMIQSLDRIQLADEIEKQCAKIQKVMPVLIEVNISREVSKSGVLLEECPMFVQHCLQYPHIDVQGLMCVGPLEHPETTEDCFHKMQILFRRLQNEYGKEHMHELSMGMSADYKTAISYGSTMVRLGTILFGKRG